MVTWRSVDASAPWYGGAVVAKIHAVVAADWPGTGNQGWTFMAFAPVDNVLQLGWYDEDPGDVWAADFDGTAIMRTAIDAYPGGNNYTSGTDPESGHIPALSVGDEVWLVAVQWGPTSPPDPTTPEAWDPLTDFGAFLDGDFGAGADIGAPWTTLEEVEPPPLLPIATSGRRRAATLTARATPPVDPVPADYPLRLIYRDSWHYNEPTFRDGWKEPKQTKSLIERSAWGRYRVLFGGRDRSFFRGVPVEVVDRGHTSPWGPSLLTLRFPQITPFEHPGYDDLAWLYDGVRVHLQRVKEDGTIATAFHWPGYVFNFRPTFDENGWALEVDVKGFLRQTADANNRPTRPAGAGRSRDIGGQIPHRLNQLVGRRFASVPRLLTGIEEWKKGALTETVMGYIDELLGLSWTDAGVPWTLLDRQSHPWQAQLVLPDPDTADYTVALGTEGVAFDLAEDNDGLPNVVYGEWVTPEGGRTQNLKFPKLRPEAAPDFPLALGSSFSPGGSDSGFAPFSEWLENNGHEVYSGDAYDSRDEDEVREVQEHMGVPVTGDVDATTWGTAFQAGEYDPFEDSIYLPIAFDKRVEPYLWTPDGQRIGRNPDYDPKIRRVETFVNFGSNMRRRDVKRAARQIVKRSFGISLVGTIRGATDPEECSFRDMRAGTTLNVPYLYGQADGVNFGVSSMRIVEGEEPGWEAEVDTQYRDAWTVTQIIQRRREARHSPARTRGRTASGLTQDTKPVFDADNGAGHIYSHPVDAETWMVRKMAAGAWGDFVRVHMETSPETEFAVMLFSRRVTSRFCQRQVGNPLASDRPYHPNAHILKGAGLIQAWGSQSQPCGYSQTDSADGYKSEDDDLTGLFEYDSQLHWWSDRIPYLYVAEWCADATNVKGRFYDAPVDF